MLLGIIILIIVVLLIVSAVDSCSGGYGFTICGIVFSAVVGFGYLFFRLAESHSYKYNQKAKNEFAKKEQDFLLYNNINGREFNFRQYIKFIVTPTQFYVRSIKEQIGNIYERSEIKKVYAVPTTKNATKHYDDKWGAAKMGAVAGVASWFGIGTIADLDSLDNLSYDVLETFVSINICIEMKDGSRLSYCLMNNENVNDTSGQRLTGIATQIGYLINTLKKRPSKRTKLNSIALNNFIPFNNEDLDAGKRLLPYAKGFPVDNETHWYCSCGTLNDEKDNECSLCNNAKKTVFEKVTRENLKNEKEKLKEELCVEEEKQLKEKKKLSKKIVKIIAKIFGFFGLIIGLLFEAFKTRLPTCIAIISAIFTCVALKFYVVWGESGFDLMRFKSFTFSGRSEEWEMYLIGVFCILQLTSALAFIVSNTIGLFLFSEKTAKRLEFATIITCLILNIGYTALGILAISTSFNDDTLAYIAILINIIITIAYFVCSKLEICSDYS